FPWGREGQCGSLPKLATCWLATAVVIALKLRSLHSSSQHRLTPLWEQISLATRSETLLRERSPKMRQIQVGNIREAIVERADYPPERLRAILEPETVAVLGYGVQGRAQSLNMKDNGVSVIIGLRDKGRSWDLAQQDGWVPGKTLFSLEDATAKGTIIQYLLSDAGQKEQWPRIKPHLTKGKALYFSHGFSIVYSDQTDFIPPKDIDVILVAPKGSGTTVRQFFLEGKGINASYAVYQDATGKAGERARALGIAIGSGYLFETTFQKEVYGDLTGERGTLVGAIYRLFLEQ